MQNIEQLAVETAIKNSFSTLQQGDQLNIFVSAKNMEVVRPFNQSYYGVPSSPTPNQQSAEKLYIVDSNGNINFPVIGDIKATGKTVEEVRKDLTDAISKYVKDPTVSVHHINFKISVMGEVVRPGQYTISEGQTTILNALALAGDLTMYGKRENVLLIRNEDGKILQERINLLDANFINSPFFQLKQGDVIYISSSEIKEKTAKMNPNTGVIIAIAGTLIGLAGIFITIFKK